MLLKKVIIIITTTATHTLAYEYIYTQNNAQNTGDFFVSSFSHMHNEYTTFDRRENKKNNLNKTHKYKIYIAVESSYVC